MNKVFKISLPIHLSELARRDLFPGQEEAFKVTERSFLGKYILGLFNDKRQLPLGHSAPPDGKENNAIDLTIELSGTLAKRSPRYVKVQIAVHEYLDHLFKEKLKTWCRAQLQQGVNRYRATEAFFGHYGLDNSSHAFNSHYEYLRKTVPKAKQQ